MIVFNSIKELAGWRTSAVQVTIGFFDGVHRGHRALLETLIDASGAATANSLVVTFQNSPRGFHNPAEQHPNLTLPHEKLLLLKDIAVDAVLLLEYDAAIASQTAAGFLTVIAEQVPITSLTIGYDSRVGCDQVQGRDGFETLTMELGIDLCYVDALTDNGSAIKSRDIRQHVHAGEVVAAKRLLGHPYLVHGEVLHGKGKGGVELSVPTANLALPAEKLVPPVGVYACAASVDGVSFPAAACVMTVEQQVHTALERTCKSAVVPRNGSAQVIIEAHLVGFSGDLYGNMMRLDFLKRLRDNVEFDSVDALHLQIERDIAATTSAFQDEQAREG